MNENFALPTVPSGPSRPAGSKPNPYGTPFMELGKALEDLMRNQPLFQVTNHHGEACGVPPQFDEQTFPGMYRSYFENQNGEQAIFLYDYEQERGILYMGDAGWEHPYDMVNGKVPDLMLNRPEQLWLSACWEASGALKAVREQIRLKRTIDNDP